MLYFEYASIICNLKIMGKENWMSNLCFVFAYLAFYCLAYQHLEGRDDFLNLTQSTFLYIMLFFDRMIYSIKIYL